MTRTVDTRHSTHRLGWLIAPAVVAALLLASCGGGGDGGAEDAAASSTTAAGGAETSTTAPRSDASGDAGSAVESDGAVTIKGFAFDPPAIKVAPGTEVTWSNDDSATHTSTGDDDEWNTKSIKPGASAAHTFGEAGTFTYHCEIHPTMTATVVVEG